jgi:hypothetical protein
MTVFESINESSNEAVDKGETYLKKSHEYYRLKVFQQLTSSVSLVFKAFIIGSLALIGLMFLAVASAIAIGNQLDSQPLGCVIVGFVFLLISGLLYAFRKHINNKVIQSMAKTFFN